MKNPLKHILFSLLLLNLLFFSGGINGLLTYANAEENSQTDCENIMSFAKAFVEQMKKSFTTETYSAYETAIKEQMQKCFDQRFQSEILSEYENKEQEGTLAYFVDKYPNATLDDLIQKNYTYNEEKNRIKASVSEDTTAHVNSQLINQSQFKQFFDGLTTMNDLINKYGQSIDEEYKANQSARLNKLPFMPKSCL